jgi:hypothetical protein
VGGAGGGGWEAAGTYRTTQEAEALGSGTASVPQGRWRQSPLVVGGLHFLRFAGVSQVCIVRSQYAAR